MYQVLWDTKAENDLAALSEKDRRIVISKVDLLMEDATPPGAIKLSAANAHRLRAGRWRIFYHLERRDRCVVISRVMKRDESTYRRDQSHLG